MKNHNFSKCIEEASLVIGKTWPLYSFVTSNPLSGYEDTPFRAAVNEANKYLEGNTLPTGAMLQQAWKLGEINADVLEGMLAEAQFYQSPEGCLKELESENDIILINQNHQLDRIVTKWLGVFMDEGLAEWEMPGRSKGFYSAWRELAVYDREIGIGSINEIPETAHEALVSVMENYPPQEHLNIFKYHIAALPGWVGYIKHRMTDNAGWQQQCPITLEDYLAVRLFMAKQINTVIMPENSNGVLQSQFAEMRYLWLKAWEKSWQNKLADRLYKNSAYGGTVPDEKRCPLAQLVFCIDTRSELIRRHIEAKGDYETFGYAGFFGIATDYRDVMTGLVRKSCPPIVPSAYIVTEKVVKKKEKNFARFKHKKDDAQFFAYLLQRLKNMLPSAFGYVEGAGIFYGYKLIKRTLFSAHSADSQFRQVDRHEDTCIPEIHHQGQTDSADTISTDEKSAIVKSAFDLLGWKQFAPLVIFTGHGSHSANNPFASSLDCGACAASPGRHNARMLAELANQAAVREMLAKQFEIYIPGGTFFIGAEHNTTTDEIVLFDTDVPESHRLLIDAFKLDLKEVQRSAIAERSGLTKNCLKEASKKAGNWAETRPEWGLAGNASFIVASRSLTKDINLESRCFLHSYNWEMDEQGNFLESIMQGPMVVTQWINNHYYFSTVNNKTFGGGSKITHNVTGKFGVVEGNGGDVKIGLPLQSVNLSDNKIFHQPLRLSVIIQAPLKRVEEILDRNYKLKSLVQNEWIYLMVMDPLASNQISCYESQGKWILTGLEKSEPIVAL
jgi:uncharacterized protein YbcC (UPF0753/DUF2309 family)